MSYASRVYRQRNPKPKDESKEKPFFSEQSEKGNNKNSFFQSKPAANSAGDIHEKEADLVADTMVSQGQSKSVNQHITSVQRLATTPSEEKVSTNDERMALDKEERYMLKPADQERKKEKKLKNNKYPAREKEKTVQNKDEDEKKDKEIHKKEEDTSKEKEKV